VSARLRIVSVGSVLDSSHPFSIRMTPFGLQKPTVEIDGFGRIGTMPAGIQDRQRKRNPFLFSHNKEGVL